MPPPVRNSSEPMANRVSFVLADGMVHADVENLIHSRQSSYASRSSFPLAPICRMAYRAGLQINEALCGSPKDFELYDGSVRVLHGSGGRSRTVGPDPGVTSVIEPWLDARSCLGLGGRHTVFCTLHGHPMAAAYVCITLKRLAARSVAWR